MEREISLGREEGDGLELMRKMEENLKQKRGCRWTGRDMIYLYK